MRKFSLAAALTVACFSLAATSAQAQSAGDGAAGATKAATCTACHGMNGNSANPEWPVLAGQNAAYLTEQVKSFRANHRIDLLMQPMAAALSDEDIADLAAFYAAQTPNGLEADPSYWEAGEVLYRAGDADRAIPACIACHGPTGRGNPAAGYPALQAQHSVYTAKQLEGYANDTRYAKDEEGRSMATPNAVMMHTIARQLTAEDRRNLASYIQGMR